MSGLTELEAVVLGILWRCGGATAYAVRAEIAASPAARFSASAGAVYPLVRRLAAAKLLRSVSVRKGKRGGRLLEPTSEGLKRLRGWLAVPDAGAELVTDDPLRTRLLFLGALPRRSRARWLEQAAAALRTHLAQARALLAADAADPWMRLAHRNVLLQAEARLRWLAEARVVLLAR